MAAIPQINRPSQGQDENMVAAPGKSRGSQNVQKWALGYDDKGTHGPERLFIRDDSTLS